MRAGAAIVAEADQVGGTRLPVLRSAPPLSLRAGGGQGWAGRALSLSAAEPPNHEQGARPRAVTVWMVGTAAGPLSGDRVGLGVEVGAGASVTVRSTAASIVLGGPSEDDSELVVDVDVGPGGELCWLPEPTV
ncbi:MAG: urease accessory protein UreD, partial [Acidimicrobiales bacterium]